MFENKTLFVVGAGASNEFGLPVGSVLAETISKLARFDFIRHGPMRGNSTLFEQIQKKFKTDSELNEALEKFRFVSNKVQTADSIDDFIDRFRNDELLATIGKLLISFSILEYEGKSDLIKGIDKFGNFDIYKFENTWINKFSRTLIKGIDNSRIRDL
ncbi:MAG: hypothetical protein R3D43_06195 [Tepidamorphaceae bacterium]